MSERLKSFWIGFFIISSLGIIAWLFLFLKPEVGDGKKILHLRATNIERISTSTRLNYAGKAVGEVVQIKLLSDPAIDGQGNLYPWELVLKYDSSVKLKSCDEIYFSSVGIMGEKMIAISPKAPLRDSFLNHEIKDEILYVQSHDNVGELMQRVTKATNDFNGLIDKATVFFDQAKENNLIPNATNTLSQLNTIAASLATGKGTIGRLLSDDTLYLQLNDTLNRLDWALYDINHYGFLYHWNSNWKKEQKVRN